jgi:hypothetical protein
MADSPFLVVACRKAYRLGKFLQDVQHLRKSKATGLTALLELVAYGGEGVYYFIERELRTQTNSLPADFWLVCRFG